MKNQIKTNILILGAGIGGYEAFRSLSKLFKKKRINKTITLVDKNNYFTFVPMLHEAAAGSIEPQHCAIPIRELIYKTPHNFVRANVKIIDPKKKQVKTSVGSISYDYCVIAMGSQTNYFSTPGAEEHTYHVRSLNGAMKLHHDLIEQLENTDEHDIQMTIVGGGFTGVEVAGQFCDFVHSDVRKLYPHKKVNMSIVETGDLLVKTLPTRVRERVTKRLEKRGVAMHLNSRVAEVKNDRVILKSGKEIMSDITIWTTGFKSSAETFLPLELTERGRIPVSHELKVNGQENLYAIGDVMFLKNEKDIPYPQLAEAAHMEGMYVAKHITRNIKGKKTKKFSFDPKGVLMPVGDWWGVMMIGPFSFFGKLPWWIRRTVYLFFMPGIVRKIKIAFDWTIHGFGFRYILDTHDGDKT